MTRLSLLHHQHSTFVTCNYRPMERVKQLTSHLLGVKGAVSVQQKWDDDVVITMAIRSPLCKCA